MIMDQFEQMKVTRQAMNGKMCLMFGGIFLMFSAITSTIMYGINFFMTALEADKGTAEYVELLENAGVGSGLLKGIGICFIAVGIWEAVVGFLSVRNSNRVDKSRFSVKLAISLLITEIVMQVILFFTGLMNLGSSFYSHCASAVFTWGVHRLGKVAKADPERKFAVDPARKKSYSAISNRPPPKKSIRERAAMQAREDVVVPEKQDTVDEENIADSEESN